MLELLTPPSTDLGPVSLPDVKAYLRIEHTDEDAAIRQFLRAATAAVEQYTNRQLLTATWRQWYDAFPVRQTMRGCVRMFRPGRSPLQTVGAIQYLDPSDATLATWTTIAAGDYRVDTISAPGRIVEDLGVSWPAPADVPQSVRVTFTAGFGAGNVPPQLEDAVRFYVGWKYRDRDEASVPDAFYRLCDPWMLYGGDHAGAG